MAKVMVSLPDELLQSLDAEASRRSTTRSGLLRNYVRDGLQRRVQERVGRVEQVMVATGRHGGQVVDDLHRHRPQA